ncbi:hypothetical protein FE257_001552 [Aspergillus nanangensis]|uniref:Zn(2)-C6 fungal-type domain-containing protein n=1 Tax=Aspergillus nanangensis TaxID=2582783 RepID=A0AAD4CTK1_ASPNN|nr:hypothetical protein FE257_001552 [Aspergillus nanangensis]
MVEPCYTCRRRRIQCDQSGIPCAKCTTSGLECFDKRPLRWVKGVAIRGKMQGRSHKESSNVTDLVKSGPGPSAIEAFPVRLTVSRPEIPLALGDPFASNLDAASKYYLDYYNDRICKLFIVYDSDENPFRSLISLAMSDQTLFKAALALAARHKANSTRSFYDTGLLEHPDSGAAHCDALLYKHQAMQRLSQDLGNASGAKDTSMASIFLLIFLDLLESGSDRWNVHLEGVKRLIETNPLLSGSPVNPRLDPGRTVSEIRNFITRQLYLIETLGATFVRPKLLSQFNFVAQSEAQLQETAEKSFLGCPEYLLNAIQSISMCRDQITGTELLDDVSNYEYRCNVVKVLEFIHNFDCAIWAQGLPHSDKSRDTNHLSILAQAYKLGAFLYGQRVLDTLTNEETPQGLVVDELINAIGSVKDDRSILKCLLWPIFVAGLECHSHTGKEFLLGCLEQFWTDTSCLNVVNAAKILQAYWKGQPEPDGDRGSFSSQWIFTIGRLGRDWLLI